MMKKKERKFRFAVFSFFLYAGDLDGNFGTVSETKNGKTKKKKSETGNLRQRGIPDGSLLLPFLPDDMKYCYISFVEVEV